MGATVSDPRTVENRSRLTCIGNHSRLLSGLEMRTGIDSPRKRTFSRFVALGLAALLAVSACAAADSSSGGTTDGKLTVVVAESFWGSIAAQLGGDRVHVTSIVSSPDADPHDYEPTPSDARAIASAQYVVFNGVGYDPWVRRSLDANDASGRRVLEVGS